MATKIISIAWSEITVTIYCIIRRETDSYRLNDADGAFTAAPADPYLSLTEDAIIKGLYEVSESRTVWTDGTYLVVVYKQSGVSPSPVADTLIGAEEIYIRDDTEVIVDASIAALLDVGSGDTAVNHNTGGVDNLRAVTIGGDGIDGVIILAYLKSEYDTGGRTLRGSSITKADGRWLYDMMLSSGLTYTLVFYKEDEYEPNNVEVTI